MGDFKNSDYKLYIHKCSCFNIYMEESQAGT